MSSHERAHAEHMARVRAIQRRSSYDRVLSKITFLEHWHRSNNIPLTEHELEELRSLHDMRDSLRQKMIDAGQIAREFSPI